MFWRPILQQCHLRQPARSRPSRALGRSSSASMADRPPSRSHRGEYPTSRNQDLTVFGFPTPGNQFLNQLDDLPSSGMTAELPLGLLLITPGVGLIRLEEAPLQAQLLHQWGSKGQVLGIRKQLSIYNAIIFPTAHLGQQCLLWGQDQVTTCQITIYGFIMT